MIVGNIHQDNMIKENSSNKTTEKFDWKWTIRINIMMLRMVGLWPAGDETYGSNFYSLYSIIVTIIFALLHNFFQTVYLFMILDNLSALTSVLFIAFVQMIAAAKSYYLMQNMGIVKQLMKTLASDMFQPKNARQRRLIKPSLDFWTKIYVAFWVSAIITFFFWGTFPILDKSVKEFRLPFVAWYPYNTKTSPFYEITYIHQIACFYFMSTVSISVDMLIAALNMYIGAQCDILCDDLKYFNYTRNVPICPRKQLINYIIHHREIVKFAKASNKFFNWIVLMQFFASAISIGITMFQLTVVVPFSSEFYTVLFYGTAIAVEIFVYCWFGNDVELKSSNIPYAAFQSNWTEASPEIKKLMIIFVLRAQTPIKMSALNLFYLTVDTFMKILRTAWSYFAVLRQVNS